METEPRKEESSIKEIELTYSKDPNLKVTLPITQNPPNPPMTIEPGAVVCFKWPGKKREYALAIVTTNPKQSGEFGGIVFRLPSEIPPENPEKKTAIQFEHCHELGTTCQRELEGFEVLGYLHLKEDEKEILKEELEGILKKTKGISAKPLTRDL